MKQPTTQVYTLRPLEDARWRDLIASHPRSSAFHCNAWLEALRRTFRFEPIAFTTSGPHSSLANAVVLCRVDSWITGHRLISLPLSDHCDPLVDDMEVEQAILSSLQREIVRKRLRYAEIRPTREMKTVTECAYSTLTYCSHRIDLSANIDTLFRRCHKNSTQRKIRRAEREGLTLIKGCTESILDHFYRLMVLTRRRHNAPPQPKAWFGNLIDCFGSALTIRLALKHGSPIAGILTLRHKDTLVYKYGCSDAGFHHFGGMQFLLWDSILEAKREGLWTFDLGRSEWGHPGLIAFKDHMGATRSELSYSRLSAGKSPRGAAKPADTARKARIARLLSLYMPDSAFCRAGEFVCRHFV